MKKGKKLLVTASLVSAAVTVSGCRFLPWMNNDQPVYGVPMDPRVTLSPIPDDVEEEVEGADVTPVEEEADIRSESSEDN